MHRLFLPHASRFIKSSNFNSFIKKLCFSVSTREHTILDHLHNCSRMKELEFVYGVMVKTNKTQNCFLVNQFITACSSFNCMDYAVLVYTQMESPNIFVYDAMLRGFVRCHHPIQALVLYAHMLEAKILPSSYTFSSLIKACALALEVKFGEVIHRHIWRYGFVSHVFIQTGLVDFYSSVGRIVESKKVFDDMPERDVFAWTTMVSGLVKVGDMSSAKRLFDKMPQKNTASWNTLIYGYAKLRDVESAECLFNQMGVKDIIAWTTMINCYSQNKKFGEALAVFSEMTKAGICPDEVTMVTVISTCAHLGALDLGKEMHLYVMQNGFDLDVYVGSSLIDMYAKCGNLDRSLLVFFKLREKNLFCWNSVIEGLAAHGYAKEAIEMFGKMVREKIRPNGVTFISVLNACAHAGLVEEGRRCFERMMHEFSIPPAIEHYGCMIDLLSKSGLLDEALELIRNMKFEPNAIIWGALLGGCKLHRNLEIARIAVDELMILEPDNTGYYTLLVNMYAEINKWDEVTKIRKTMKELGIEKKWPGSSWIEMEREVHQFAASDKSHPASDEIHSLLTELDGQLKLAGRVNGLWPFL